MVRRGRIANVDEGAARTGFRVEDDVLVASYAGTPSFETLKKLAREIAAAALERGLTKVLADLQELDTSPSAVERLLLGSAVAERWPKHVRLAVLIAQEMNTPDHLFENAASQRGVPVIVTHSYDEAMRWLHRAETRP
jgi:hypothetical protein